MLIYLHGFRSSPLSGKAQLLSQRMTERGLGERLWCRQLPAAPREAIALVEETIARSAATPTLVGSSLGGYYATYLAERHDLRAVLINPAVAAQRLLASEVGPQSNLYTGEQFEFTAEDLAQLGEIEVPRLSRPERFWLLVETGDEVLDYREAVAKYAGARQTVVEGGDHSLQSFPRVVDEVIDFFLENDLRTPAAALMGA